MSSKLFHTVVAVGIAIGAAACAAPAEPETTSDQNAITTSNADKPAAADDDAIQQAFCDVSWPTTKGGTARPTSYRPACIDPTNACASAGEPFPCSTAGGFNCSMSVCKDGAWACAKDEQRRETVGAHGVCYRNE